MPRPNARWRLVCLAHAGGGPAAFQAWPRHLPAWIEVHAVQLPGRMQRLAEPPPTDLATLLPQLGPALLALCDRPMALLGHSLGALLAFATSQAWRSSGASPQHLFALAAPAPHLSSHRPAIHTLSDTEFLDAVRAYGGLAAEIERDTELLALVLPALRADFALAASYHHQPEPPLACPITALGGNDDPFVPAPAIEAWRLHTTSQFTLRLLPGGHFFTQTNLGLIADIIVAQLA